MPAEGSSGAPPADANERTLVLRTALAHCHLYVDKQKSRVYILQIAPDPRAQGRARRMLAVAAPIRAFVPVGRRAPIPTWRPSRND